MIEQLRSERTRKTSELADISARYERLENEIKMLQDKNYQVKKIEEELSVRYAETRKNFPIDRETEAEARSLIKEKQSDIENVCEDHKNDLECAEHLADLDRESASNRYWEGYVSGWYFSKELERERERANKRNEKEYETRKKEIQKRYDARRKAINKSCLDELKRIFGELDVDAKRFYKKGLSRETLLLFADVMTDICKKGEKIGTIPVSYQQKIYKLQVAAEEIPIDEEMLNKENEEAAKESLYKEKDKAQKHLSLLEKKCNKIESSLSKKEKELENLKKKLQQFEQNRQKQELAISKKSEQKKQSLEKESEIEEKRIKKLHEENCAQLQNSIKEAQNLLKQKQTETDALQKQKNGFQEELAVTFVLSFGKKRLLKNQIVEIEKLIVEKNNEIASLEQELQTYELEKNASPKKLSDMLQEKSKALKTALADEDKNTKKCFNTLKKEHTDLKDSIKNTEKEIASLQKELSHEYKLREDAEKQLSKVLQELDNFHIDYTIKTFGQEFRLTDILKQKNLESKELTKTINELKAAVSAIDKELKKLEKEFEIQQEQKRKALIEKAKEEERIRLEQKERQERIQNEILEREKEQSIIVEKSNSFDHIEALVRTFESDPDQKLLQEERCPIEDDGKRVILNGIVRKHYTQKISTPFCERYVLFFVDQNGQPISDQRLLEQKPIGEKTTTSFELKSSDGFKNENYYLLIMNFETNELISAQKYKINISFANDFDF